MTISRQIWALCSDFFFSIFLLKIWNNFQIINPMSVPSMAPAMMSPG